MYTHGPNLQHNGTVGLRTAITGRTSGRESHGRYHVVPLGSWQTHSKTYRQFLAVPLTRTCA